MSLCSCLQVVMTADNIVIATGMRPKYPTQVSYINLCADTRWLKALSCMQLFVGRMAYDQYNYVP